MAETVLYLLRHAESAPCDEMPEADWPLTAGGRRQASALIPILASLGIHRVYSSPYRRAIKTVAPFAASYGLDIEIVPDLRERQLSPGGLVPDWLESVRRSWADLDYSLSGGESGRACQGRIKECLDILASRPCRTLLACSHGNAIGFYLKTLAPSFGYEQWLAMRRPDLFRVVYDGGVPRWDRGFIWP